MVKARLAVALQRSGNTATYVLNIQHYRIYHYFDFWETRIPLLPLDEGGATITYFRKQTDIHRQALSQRLRQAREEAGLLQGDAARKLGIPQSILSELEHGQRRLDMAELMAIAEIYGKAPAWFLELPEPQKADQQTGK